VCEEATTLEGPLVWLAQGPRGRAYVGTDPEPVLIRYAGRVVLTPARKVRTARRMLSRVVKRA
jgi:hypothetical protein